MNTQADRLDLYRHLAHLAQINGYDATYDASGAHIQFSDDEQPETVRNGCDLESVCEIVYYS